jgi:hypothetical protein
MGVLLARELARLGLASGGLAAERRVPGVGPA